MAPTSPGSPGIGTSHAASGPGARPGPRLAPGFEAAQAGLHVLGAGESAGVPVLWATPAGGGPVRAVPLSGPFALHVGGPRTCVGRWQEGRHVPCASGAAVWSEPQCQPCSGLEHPACVFEPICQGNAAACLCVSSFQGVEHAVYVAFHGALPKVGMTQVRRLPARLKEQGADLYFVVARGLDRAAARQLERGVSVLHGLPEHRSHRETLPALARPVDWEHLEARAASLRDRLAAHHPVEPVLHRVADHPLRQPLPGRPRRVATYGWHRGTWLGAKGVHLFYAEEPTPGRLDTGQAPVAALKRSDLPGHVVRL